MKYTFPNVSGICMACFLFSNTDASFSLILYPLVIPFDWGWRADCSMPALTSPSDAEELQSYIEMLVEVIWPVISVSLKHLVNFHFCRAIINLFNSIVYTKSSSIPIRSKVLFCLIETALLEVVKNTICCSQISPYLIIKPPDGSHVRPFSEQCLRLCSWSRSWALGHGLEGCFCPQAAHSHRGADSDAISVTVFWNMRHPALFTAPLTCGLSSVVFTLTQGGGGSKGSDTVGKLFFLFFNLQHRLLRPKGRLEGRRV